MQRVSLSDWKKGPVYVAVSLENAAVLGGVHGGVCGIPLVGTGRLGEPGSCNL